MPNQTLFDQRMDAMSDDLRDLRTAMSEVAKALTKLSVMEERNAVTNQAVEKIAARQDRIEHSLSEIRLEQVKFESNINGMTTAIKWMWTVCGAGIVAVGAAAIKHAI